MRLVDFRKERSGDLVQVSARVVWETIRRRSQEIFIATVPDFESDITPEPEAFITGALIPALHLGEKRIALEKEVCPRLIQNLETVMGLMHHWSGGRMKPLKLEVSLKKDALYQGRRRRAGMFLSGGIDSLASLRLNRMLFSQQHQDYIQDCLLLHGFDIGGVIQRGAKYHVFERAKRHMAEVAKDAGVTLLPVYTNIRHLCDDRDLWLNRFFGAVLAAVALAFAARFHLVNIAASYDIYNLVPCGSHPMLDPLFSSADLAIRHCDVHLRRIDKLRIVARWQVALDNMRVCLANVAEHLNCGRCEKCVRTMCGLEAIGALEKCRAFTANRVDPDLFDAFDITIRHRQPFYEELLESLEARGSWELVARIRRELKQA